MPIPPTPPFRPKQSPLRLAFVVLVFVSGCRNAVRIPDPDLSRSPPAVRRAIGNARQHVADAPQSAAAWGRLGELYFVLQFPDEAMTCLQEAERLAPAEGKWPYLLAMLCEENDLRRAAEYLSESTRRSPRVAAAQLRKALVLSRLGREQEAETALDAAQRLAQDEAAPLLLRARNSMTARNWDGALRDLRDAARLAPSNRGVLLELARCHSLMGHDREAAAALQEASGAFPGDPVLPDPWLSHVFSLELTGQSLADQADRLLAAGQLKDAEQLLQRLAGEHPELPRSWLNLLLVRAQLGRFDEARATASELVRRFPDDPTGYLGRAKLLISAGEFSAAQDDLSRALHLKPDSAEANYLLGVIADRQQRTTAAEASYRTALHISPSHVESLLALAVLLWQKQQRAEAIQQLDTAVRLAPQNGSLATLLSQWKTQSASEAPASAITPANAP